MVERKVDWLSWYIIKHPPELWHAGYGKKKPGANNRDQSIREEFAKYASRPIGFTSPSGQFTGLKALFDPIAMTYSVSLDKPAASVVRDSGFNAKKGDEIRLDLMTGGVSLKGKHIGNISHFPTSWFGDLDIEQIREQLLDYLKNR